MEKYAFITMLLLASTFEATPSIQPTPDDGPLHLQEGWSRWVKILEIVASILASFIAMFEIIRRLRWQCRAERRQEREAAEEGPQNQVELPLQNQNPSTQAQPSAGPSENGEEATSALQSITSEASAELEEVVVQNPPTQQQASVGVEGTCLP